MGGDIWAHFICINAQFRFTCQQTVFPILNFSYHSLGAALPWKLRSRSCRRLSKHPVSCKSLIFVSFSMSLPAAAGNAQFCTDCSYPTNIPAQQGSGCSLSIFKKLHAVWISFVEKYFILQLGLKKKNLNTTEVLRGGINSALWVIVFFCINLSMIEGIHLPRSSEMLWLHSHWYNSLLLGAFLWVWYKKAVFLILICLHWTLGNCPNETAKKIFSLVS